MRDVEAADTVANMLNRAKFAAFLEGFNATIGNRSLLKLAQKHHEELDRWA